MSQAEAIPTRNPSRRQALTGALAVPFVVAPATAAVADPILDLIAQHDALLDACPDDTDPEAGPRWSREVLRFEQRFFDARPISRVGAFAAARHALREMSEFAGVDWATVLLGRSLDWLEREV